MKIYAAAAAMALLTTFAHAQTVAYDVPVQPGNQGFTGNLGLDFNVNQSILVTGLGAFDSNGDGFTNNITVAIFNRDTQAQIGTLVSFIPGTGAPLVNGSRMAVFPGGFSFILTPGHYSVVAVGFSAADLNGNATTGPPFTPSTENTGGGLISFVGNGRYDSNTSLDFPLTCAGCPGTPTNIFLAGTFEFTAVAAPTLSKVFGSASIPAGGTTSLTFHLSNPNTVELTGLQFSDVLPSGLMIATPNGLSGSCGGGTITAVAGSSLIGLSGASLAGGSSCTFSLNVTSPLAFSSVGTKTNTTSGVGSNEAPNGAPAVANVVVTAYPYLSSSWWYWYVL